MVNAVGNQYNQYGVQQPLQGGQAPQVQTIPGSNGAVTIQIFNPVATNGMPVYTQNSFYSPQGATPQYPYTVVPKGQESSQGANASSNVNVITPALNNNQGAINNTPQNVNKTEKSEEKKPEEKSKKVILTDEYIMSLENYLNNENPKIRLMGIKEVLDRFKEDKSRVGDLALTALLNKALQDPLSSVRYMAFAILDAGYATGNEETIQILKNIQANSDKEYAEDSLAVSDILLKMSHETVEVPKGTGW